MNKLITIIFVLALSATTHAALSVTQAVFSITSSASTSTANLRVAPMDMKLGKDGNLNLMQTYVLQAGVTQNMFLTKSQTVSLNSLCVLIQVDQDTKMKINSETAFLTVYSGADTIRCFK